PAWGRPLADALVLARGSQLIRTRKRQGRAFDLIHGHNYEGGLVGTVLARLHGLPLLYHAHNLMGDELETYFEASVARRTARLVGQALDRIVPGLADGCVAVSQHTCRALSQGPLGERLLSYHPPAVDYGPRCLKPDAGSQTDLVYLGNLDGYQAVEVMLGALARLPQTTCTVVTPDPETRWKPLMQRFGLVSRVTVVPHGPFETVKPILEGARVALLPRTVPSGFPIKLLNYLAAGRPVVACRGGAQGLGRDQGVCVVEDGDEDAMARAIAQLLKDNALRAELGERAREAAREFTWPTRVAHLAQTYATLLPKARFRRFETTHQAGSQGRAPLLQRG
ncbi:MAG: glycosyltransferase family 4 protein, partial [Myxococcota bacterium]